MVPEDDSGDNMVRERLELRPGALVVGTDGGLGWIHELLAVPGRGEISDFVLREGLLFSRDITISIEAVAWTDNSRVHISLSADQIHSLADSRARGLTRLPAEQERPTAIAERVVCRDGDIGRLALVFLDKATHRMTHLVVRRNGSAGQDTVVPAEWVREMTDDPIVIDIDRRQVDRQPEYRPDLNITDAVSSVLWYRSDLHPSDVHHVTVRTRDGIVQLSGTTRTDRSRMAIDALIRDIGGVLGVNNQLKTFETLSAASDAFRRRDGLPVPSVTNGVAFSLTSRTAKGAARAGRALPQEAVAEAALGTDVARPLRIVA
jgi:hypothetical protein